MGQTEITLQDRVVLVTGASRGIGEAIALACVDAGARVVLASRKQADLDQVAARIAERGGTALALACHMGRPEEIERLFAAAADRLGPIDALVNNAATNPYLGPLIDTPGAAFDKIMEVNVKGYLYAIRQYVLGLRARGARRGSIVNITSIAGMLAARTQGAYAMSKAAVSSMTRTLALELGSSDIRVNAIAPGLIETRFSSVIVENPELRDQMVMKTPLGRHGQPDEIAAAAVYLLSDAASFVTGHVMVIDGGFVV